MLWLAVHLPMFALETSQAGQETQVPTVLVDDSRVVLGNRAALDAGIRPQSTLATAHGICPQLMHCRRDAGRERKRLRLLAEMCYRFTSRVSIEPPQGARVASGLLLEAGGSLALFGALPGWQSQVATLCQELDHAAVLRTAATPSAALALARAGASRLEDVPLAHTELDESDVESLFNMGIGKLGPLLRLPEAELGPRFGTGLTNYLQRLAGKAPDPRRCIEPAPVFASSLHLLDPITDKEALLFPMRRLLGELEHWLIAPPTRRCPFSSGISRPTRRRAGFPCRCALRRPGSARRNLSRSFGWRSTGPSCRKTCLRSACKHNPSRHGRRRPKRYSNTPQNNGGRHHLN